MSVRSRNENIVAQSDQNFFERFNGFHEQGSSIYLSMHSIYLCYRHRLSLLLLYVGVYEDKDYIFRLQAK